MIGSTLFRRLSQRFPSRVNHAFGLQYKQQHSSRPIHDSRDRQSRLQVYVQSMFQLAEVDRQAYGRHTDYR